MILKSIIVFAVLDNGKIHQILLDTKGVETVKSTLVELFPQVIKCSYIDFSDTMQLPEDE